MSSSFLAAAASRSSAAGRLGTTRSMRVPVKTLNGDAASVELDGDGKVADLKSALAELRVEWRPPTRLKLICGGTVLADAEPLSETVAKFVALKPEHNFVVLVAKGEKAAITPAGAAAASDFMKPVRDMLGGGSSHSPSALMQSLLSPGATPAASTLHEAYDHAVAQHKGAAAAAAFAFSAAAGGLGTSAAASAASSDTPSFPLFATPGLVPPMDAAPTADTDVPGTAVAAAADRAAPDTADGKAPRRDATGRRGLAFETPMPGHVQSVAQRVARLQSMPEIQQLLRRPRLEGVAARPADLQRLLKAVLFQPAFQQAITQGEVSDEMLDVVLRGGLLEPRPAEAYMAFAEEALAAARARDDVLAKPKARGESK